MGRGLDGAAYRDRIRILLSRSMYKARGVLSKVKPFNSLRVTFRMFKHVFTCFGLISLTYLFSLAYL